MQVTETMNASYTMRSAIPTPYLYTNTKIENNQQTSYPFHPQQDPYANCIINHYITVVLNAVLKMSFFINILSLRNYYFLLWTYSDSAVFMS